jgi:hypothetical protein
MTPEELPLGNSWEFCYTGYRRNTATGAREDATGLTGLEAWFSAEEDGGEIHADLRKELAARSSNAKQYYAIVTGATLTERLADYEGQTIYEVFSDGETVLYSVPRKVVAVRH